MIVVDTNVIAYLYLPGPHSRAAEALLASDPDWAAPILWRSEMRNLLAGVMRRRLLTLAQAGAVIGEAEQLLAGAEHEVDSATVLQLAQASGCSAYDCEFVALAEALAVPLVTLDRQVLRAFPVRTRALAAG